MKGMIAKGQGDVRSDAAQIKEMLREIGVSNTSIIIQTDYNSGAAMVAFEFEGRRYERRSINQADAPRNLFAIKRNLAHKILDHTRGVEPFHDSMLKYAALPPSQEDGGTYAPPADIEVVKQEDWAVLGIPETSTSEQIKKVYRQKLKFYHPDRFDSDAEMKAESERKTSELNGAYGRICKMRRIE